MATKGPKSKKTANSEHFETGVLGGRQLLMEQVVSHHHRVLHAQPDVRISQPQQFPMRPKNSMRRPSSTGRMYSSAERKETPRERYELEVHQQNIQHMLRRIHDQTTLKERRKNTCDPDVYPVYMLRRDHDAQPLPATGAAVSLTSANSGQLSSRSCEVASYLDKNLIPTIEMQRVLTSSQGPPFNARGSISARTYGSVTSPLTSPRSATTSGSMTSRRSPHKMLRPASAEYSSWQHSNMSTVVPPLDQDGEFYQGYKTAPVVPSLPLGSISAASILGSSHHGHLPVVPQPLLHNRRAHSDGESGSRDSSMSPTHGDEPLSLHDLAERIDSMSKASADVDEPMASKPLVPMPPSTSRPGSGRSIPPRVPLSHIASATPESSADPNMSPDSQKQLLASLMGERVEMQKRLSDLQSEKQDLLDLLDRTSKADAGVIASLTKQVEDAKADKATLQSLYGELQSTVLKNETEIAALRQQVEQASKASSDAQRLSEAERRSQELSERLKEVEQKAAERDERAGRLESERKDMENRLKALEEELSAERGKRGQKEEAAPAPLAQKKSEESRPLETKTEAPAQAPVADEKTEKGKEAPKDPVALVPTPADPVAAPVKSNEPPAASSSTAEPATKEASQQQQQQKPGDSKPEGTAPKTDEEDRYSDKFDDDGEPAPQKV